MKLTACGGRVIGNHSLSPRAMIRLSRVCSFSLLSLAIFTNAAAQGSPGIGTLLPAWADTALHAAGLGERFTLSSTLNPTLYFADFDNDGLLDIAVEIRDTGGLRRGIAVVHGIDRSVHILGAGQPLGSDMDALPAGATWGVVRLLSHHEGLFVHWSLNKDAFLVWNGRDYVWVPDPQ